MPLRGRNEAAGKIVAPDSTSEPPMQLQSASSVCKTGRKLSNKLCLVRRAVGRLFSEREHQSKTRAGRGAERHKAPAICGFPSGRCSYSFVQAATQIA
eukprot:362772-Chlamydomonas_euryale.AAC.6